MPHVCWVETAPQGKLVGRVFEWLLPQPVDDCLRVLASCLLGGKEVAPLMCSTTETIGSNSADDGEDTVSALCFPCLLGHPWCGMCKW